MATGCRSNYDPRTSDCKHRRSASRLEYGRAAVPRERLTALPSYVPQDLHLVGIRIASQDKAVIKEAWTYCVHSTIRLNLHLLSGRQYVAAFPAGLEAVS